MDCRYIYALCLQEVKTLVEEIEAKIQETLATEEEAQQAVRKATGTATDKRLPPSAVKSKGTELA
jgi:hypothetical protein